MGGLGAPSMGARSHILYRLVLHVALGVFVCFADFADASTAQASQSCLTSQQGGTICGIPQDLVAGGNGVTVTVLLKDSAGASCAPCDATASATLGGVASDTVSCLTSQGEGICYIRWNLVQTAGSVSLAVTVNGQALQGSPYSVNIAPADDGIQSGKSKSAISFNGAAGGPVNSNLILSFTLKDEYYNLITTTSVTCSVLSMSMQLVGSAGAPKSVACSGPVNGVFTGTYSSTISGNWTVVVSGTTGLITQATVTLTAGGAVAAQSTVTVDNLNPPLAAQQGVITLTPRDTFSNVVGSSSDPGVVWSLSVSGFTPLDGGSATVPPMTFSAAVWHQGGTYTVQFQTTRSGQFAVQVVMGSNVVGGGSSTTAVKVEPNLFSGATMVPSSEYASPVANVLTTFKVRGVDQYGNRHSKGSVAMTATLTRADWSLSPQTLTTTGGTDGTTSASFQLTMSGSYALALTMTNTGQYEGTSVIGASPYTVGVLPVETGLPVRFVFTPPAAGLTSAAGTAVTLSMREVDVYGNLRTVSNQTFSVQLTGAQTSLATVQDAGLGSYGLIILLTRSGTYTVQVASSSGTVIPTTAFSLVISPAAMAALGTIRSSFPGYDGGGNGGVDASTNDFAIRARDAYGNDITTGGLSGSISFSMTACSPTNVPCAANAPATWGTHRATTSVVDGAPSYPGFYGLSYTTTVGGYYAGEIKYNNENIYLSPTDLFVAAGYTIAATSYAFGPALTSCGHVLVTNELASVTSCLNASNTAETTFGVRLVDHYGNERISSSGVTDVLVFNTSSVSDLYNSNAAGAQTVATNKLSVQQTNGVQVVGFTATISSRYRTSIVHRTCAASGCVNPVDNGPILNTPVYVFVGPAPAHAPYSFSKGPGMSLATAGILSSFVITTRDVFYNTRVGVVSAVGDDTGWLVEATYVATGLKSTGAVNGQANGEYIGSYTMTTAGSYSLSVKRNGLVLASGLGNMSISASPYSMFVYPNVASAPSIITSGSVVTGFAGTATSVRLSAYDVFGNKKTRGGDTFQGILSALNMTTITQTDFTNGTYNMNYFVTKAGRFSVNVKIGGSDIIGSPLTVDIHPGVSVANSSEVVHRNIATAGRPLTFQIFSRDQFFNQRTLGGDTFDISCTMPSDPTVQVSPVYEDQHNGSYVGYCMLLKAGAYSVSVTGSNPDGTHLNVIGSPFAVTVEPNVADPMYSGVYGDALSLTTAGTWSTFRIFARDRFYNPNTGSSAATFFMTVQRTVNSTNQTVPFCPPSIPTASWGSVTTYPAGVLGGNSTVNGTCISANTGQGYFVMSYLWTVSGTYQAQVTVDVTGSGTRTPIQDSNLKIRVISANFSLSRSTAEGRGYSFGTAGENNVFMIQGRDLYSNVRTAGGGEFDVQIVHTERGVAANASSVDNGNGTFTVSYQGQVKGVYAISIQKDSVYMKNSPSNLTLLPARADPTHFEVIAGPWPSDGGVVGQNVTFLLQSQDRFSNIKTLGNNVVSVVLTGGWMNAQDGTSFATAHTVNGRVSDLGTGIYVLSYNTLRSGDFNVSVKVADPITSVLLPVKGSPFSVRVRSGPISASESIAMYTLPNGTVVVLGPGKVQNVALTDNDKTLTILAKDAYGNPRFTGGYDDLFSVKMIYDGPFGDVGLGNERLMLNLSLSVHYRCSNGSGAADLTCGEYTTSYPATISGRYKVETRFNGTLIKNSGHLIRMTPGGIDAATTSTIFPQLVVDATVGYRITTAGNPSTFTVLARDFYGNKMTQGGAEFTVTVRGNSSANNWVSFSGKMENSTRYFKWTEAAQRANFVDPSCNLACVSDKGDGSYIVVINPTVTGQYAVQVSLGDNLICQNGCLDVLRNPYTFQTVPNDIYAPFCNAYGDGISRAAAGVVGFFYVQARDQYGNKRTTSRWNPLTSDYNGEFFASSVSFDGYFLTPNQCSCTLGVCTGCGAASCLTNACGTQLIGYPKVTDNKNGIYSVAYQITQAARYTVSIRKALGNELRHISGSPFQLDMTSGATDPLSCSNSGDLYKAEAGMVGTVMIQARDFYGNLRLKGGDRIQAEAQHTTICTPDGAGGCALCTAEDPMCAWAVVPPGVVKPLYVDGRVYDLGNGDYIMNYTLTKSGNYKLNIKLGEYVDNQGVPLLTWTHLGGRTVFRSPFALVCRPSVLDPSQSTVNGDGSSRVTVSVESSFILWPRDRFGNSLAGSSDRVQIMICNTGAVCTARTGVAYLMLRVYNKGTGKFHDVRDKFNPGQNVEDLSKGKTILAEVRANADFSNTFIFSMPEVGDYIVYLDFQGVPILGTPLNMTVFPVDNDPDPSKCLIEPGDDFVAGRMGRALLTIRNQYLIKIPSATIRDVNLLPSPNNPSKVQPGAVSLLDGTFWVSFSATRAGSYSIGVGVTNPAGAGFVDIPGSPVTMNVVPNTFDPPSSVAFVSNLKEVEAGVVITFNVRNRDSYGNELTSNSGVIDSYAAIMGRIAGSSSEVVNAIFTPTEPVGYVASFSSPATGLSLTTRSGVYRLTVTNLGFGIVNSPFDINVLPAVVDERQCLLTSDNARLMTAGTYAYIYVQSKDRFGNNRTLPGDNFVFSKVLDASQPAPLIQEVSYQSDGITRAAIKFEKIGTYSINVTLNGISVQESPFSSIVFPGIAWASNCYNSTPVPSHSIAGDTMSFTIQAVDAYGNLHDTQNAVFDVSLRGFDFLRTFVNGVPCTPEDGSCVYIAYVGGGCYTATFRPTVAGDYLITANLVSSTGVDAPIGVESTLTGSPWRRCRTCGTLLVTPSAPLISASQFTGTGVSRFASGVLATFTLFSKDVFSNSQTKGGSQVTATLVGGNPFGSWNVTVEDSCSPFAQDLCGQYALSYLHTVSGVYVLTVTMDSQQSTPFTVVGYPNESPDPSTTGLEFSGNQPPICLEVCTTGQCCLLGEAASYGFVGVQNEFLIVARDQYGNQMTKGGENFAVEIVGKTRGEGWAVDLQNGQYLVQYRVLVKGIYSLSVRLRGIHIGFLYDACEGANMQCFMGSPFTGLEMSPKGTGLEGITYSGLKDGVVAESYTVEVNTEDGAAQRTLEQDAFQASLQLYKRGDQLVDTASVNVQNPSKKLYLVSYSTTRAGLWSLNIMSGDVHAPGSPFTVKILPGPSSPSKTTIRGPGTYGAVVNQQTFFYITTADQFGNERTSLDPGINDQVRYAVVPDGQTPAQFGPESSSPSREYFGDQVGRYKGFYTKSPAGVYKLFMWVASQSTGTPHPINIYASAGAVVADNTIVWGEGLEVGTAGSPLTFSIEMRDNNKVKRTSGGNQFQVQFTDVPTGQTTSYGMESITDNLDGTYVFSKTITKAVDYSITLALQGQTWINIAQATSQITVYPSTPVASSSIVTDQYPWLVASGLVSRSATSLTEFVIKLQDRFGNQVARGVPVSQLSVEVTGDASPLAEIQSSFCTFPTITKRLVCTNTDQNNVFGVWYDNTGIYRVKTAATVAGGYLVSVKLNDENIGGSPFAKQITSGFADDRRSYVRGEDVRTVQAGDEGAFAVFARDMYGNSLDKPFTVEVALTGPQPTTGIVAHMAKDQVEVSYLVTLAGMYEMSVVLDAQPMANSPFSLTVKPGNTAAFACIAEGSALTAAVAGAPGIFRIDARDTYGNQRTEGGDDMRVSIAGNSIVAGATEDLLNGSYIGTYTISIAGPYALSLLVGPDEFMTNLLMCEAGPIDLQATTTQIPLPKRLVAGNTVTYAVQARDRFGSKIVKCVETSAADISIMKADTSATVTYNGTASYTNGTAMCVQGVYSGRFHVTATGLLTGTIMIGGESIFGSPFSATVRAGPTAGYNCFATGDQLIIAGLLARESGQAGKLATFTIHSRDAFGNKVVNDPFAPLDIFNVVLQLGGTLCTNDGKPYGSDAICLKADVKSNGDSTYSVSYVPQKAGRFEVAATYIDPNGVTRLISNSPFTTDVLPASVDSSHTIALNPPVNVTVEAFTTFTVITRDRFDNRLSKGGLKFNSILTTRGSSPGDLTPIMRNIGVVDNDDGSYEMSFQVTAAGNYRIEIMNEGARIQNSPREVLVKPGPLSLADCTVSGNGIIGAFTGARATFSIEARDRNGNKLTAGGAIFVVSIFTPKDLERNDGIATLFPPPRDNGDGTYLVTYLSSERGFHRMTVKGIQEDNSEVTIRGGQIDQLAIVEDDGSPSIAGRSVAFGSGLMGAWAGEQASFTVQQRNAQGLNTRGGITVTTSMQSADTVAPVKVDVTQVTNLDGTVLCTYSSRTAGIYILNVRMSGEDILGSPFMVQIRPTPSVPIWSQVKASSLTSIVGEMVTFGLLAKDQFANPQMYDAFEGPDKFEARLEEAATKTQLNASLQNNEDGTYAFVYAATVSGSYSLRVTLNGEVVDAFEDLPVSSGPATTDKCSAEGMSPTMMAGESRTLLISARDMYSNPVLEGFETFNVSVAGSDGVIEQLGVAKYCGPQQCVTAAACPCPKGATLGVYALTFSLTKSKSYVMSVVHNQFQIPGFPYNFRVEYNFAATHMTTVVGCEGRCSAQKQSCTSSCNGCTCPAIATMRAGIQESFVLQTRDMFGNSFKDGRKAFRVTARKSIPAGKSECLRSEGCIPAFVEADVRDTLDGSYHISWVFSVLGDYDVDVTRSGEHIEGSPFKMRVLPGVASPSVGGSVFSIDPIATAGVTKTFTIEARDAYGNALTQGGEQFSVRLIGASQLLTGTIVVGSVEDYQDGTYLAYWKMVRAGSYRLEVKLNGKLVSPGAVTVSVIPARARADMSTLSGTGLYRKQSAGSTALDPTYFPPEIRVIARDSYNNIYNFDGLLMQVHVSGPESRSLNSTDKTVSKYEDGSCGVGCGQYVFFNSLQKAGRYVMHVYLYNTDAFGRVLSREELTNPAGVTFDLSGAGTDATKSYFAGPGADGCSTDSVCRFQIQALDAFGNILDQGGDVFEVSLTLISTDMTRLSFKGTVLPANRSASTGLPYTAGLYDVSYQVTRSGSYTLQVTRYGVNTAGSPKTIIIAAGTVSAAATTASGFGIIGGVYEASNPNNKLTFTVTARDKYGNVVEQPSILTDLQQTVISPTLCPACLSVNPLPTPGLYLVEYIPNGPQTYTIAVKVKGSNIMNKVFSARVYASTDAAVRDSSSVLAYTTVEGAASKQITVGQIKSFTVHARRPDLVELSNSPWTYDVVFSSATQYDPPECPSCAVNPIAIPAHGLACCVSQNQMNAALFPTINVATTQAGIVSYDVIQNGFEFDKLPGNPFTLQVLPGPTNANNCTIESASLTPIDVSTAGFPNQLRLVARDWYGNQQMYQPNVFAALRVTVSHLNTGVTSPITLLDTADGAFSMQYTVTRSGRFLIDVRLSGQPFGNSPTVVTVQPEVLSARFSDVSFNGYGTAPDGTHLATAGKSSAITVQSRDTYGNSLTDNTGVFQVVMSDTGSMIVPSYVGGGAYSATQVLTVSGTYSMYIFNVAGGCTGPDDCTAILGSPFSITVAPSSIDPSKCLVTGPGKRSGVAGQASNIIVVMRDQYGNQVTDLLTDSSFAVTVSSRARPLSGNLYVYDEQGTTPVNMQGVIVGVGAGGLSAYYRAPMHGMYQMTVTYSGVEIGGTIGVNKPRPQIAMAYPPQIASAKFSDSGGHIYVTFDKPTDKASKQGKFPCSIILEAFTVLMLGGSQADGNSAMCIFTTSTLLDIILEFGATIQPNDDLYWNADVIRLAPACLNPDVCFKHSRSIQGTTRVGRPDNAIQPTAVLKAPPMISSCDDLVLDASSSTGSGGRDLQFFFGLEPGSSNDAQVRSYILSATSADPLHNSGGLKLPSHLLLSGQNYTFLVRAINFLDQSDVASVSVYKSYGSSPAVDVEGPNVIYAKSSKSMKLRGMASMSSCNKVPGEVLFQWRIASVTPALPSPLALHETSKTRQLYIPENSLAPGHVYQFELRGTMKNNVSSYGLATVTVNCYFAPLVARVQGGNRAVSVDEDLVLDASGSLDLDGDYSTAAFTFRWSCTSEAGGACFVDTMGLLITEAARLIIPAGILLPGTYNFRVVASKEPGPRTAVADLVVYVQPLPMHRVEIEALTKYKFNANEVLRLTGVIADEQQCSQEWTQLAGDKVLVHGPYLTTAPTLLSIKFKTNVLDPGASYRFRLQATCSINNAIVTGFSEVSVRMNAAPSSGQFFVSPLVGQASSTTFNMQLVNWVDDLEDLPFTYEFRYATEAAPTEMIPLGQVDVNNMPATLPGPSVLTKSQHTITLYGKVIDQFQGEVTVSRTVVVKRPADAQAQRRILAFSTAELDNAVLTQDAEKIIQLTSALATEPGLTCTAKDSMISTLQTVSKRIVMTATEIAGFQAALGNALAGTCVHDGVRRLTSDSSVVQALDMTSSLLGSTIKVGLDPTAETSSGNTLSSALDTLSTKNSQRRRIRELLGIRRSGPTSFDEGSGRFRRGRSVTTLAASSDPGNTLMSGLAGLASSQLNGAVTGEDAKTLQTGSISMLAKFATAESFSGSSLGSGSSRFTTPAGMFAAGQGTGLAARTSSLATSPFESDFMLGGVSSLSFGVTVSNLQDPIELSMPATVSANGQKSVYVCSSTGSSNQAEYPDVGACLAACFNRPASSSYSNSSNTLSSGSNTSNVTNASTSSASTSGTCARVTLDSCKADLWTPCVNGEIDTCMFWNGHDWDGEGCIVHQMDLSSNKIQCHCYHLTDFGGAASNVLPKMNVVDPTNPGALFANFSPDKILIICIVVGMLVMYWCLCYWGWRQDRIDNEKAEGEEGRLSKKMQKRMDEREQDDTLLDASNPVLLQKSMKDQVGRSILMIRNKAMRIVRTQHKLFGGFFAKRTHYTRPRRFTVLFCMIIGNMVINAIFAGAEDTNFIQKIIGGILAALIMTPATIIFKTIFMSLGVDPKTRARWERNDAERFKQRRAEMALSVTEGPTASGIAAPPAHLKANKAPPPQVNRGYVPHPDHQHMRQGQALEGPARFKRKQLANANAAAPEESIASSAVLGSLSVAGSNFGWQPPPPPGQPSDFMSAVPGVGSDGEPQGEKMEVGAYIPRRALPLGGSARPPAPVMRTEPDNSLTNSGAVMRMMDDDDFEGGEKIEGMQDISVHTKKSDKKTKESYESKIAKAAIKALIKPSREVAAERRKKLMDHRFQYLAYLMAFMWYMVCCYFAILYGLKFSTAIEHAWLLAFFISLLQDLFINETLIISASTSIKYVVLPNIASWAAWRIIAKQK